MNLHLVPDDKYVSRLIERVEALGLLSVSHFIVKTPPPFRYVKQAWLRGAHTDSAEFSQLAGDLSSYKKIFVHFMDDASIRWIVANDLRNVYWLVWGADIYESLFSDFKPHDRQTTKLLGATLRNRVNRTLYKTLQQLKQRSVYRKAYARVKYMGNWIYDEYRYAVDHLPGLRCEHKFFIYDQDIPFDKLAAMVPDPRKAVGKPIRVQLGQSTTPAGNHASALEEFRNVKGIGEVVIPASYGSDFYSKRLEHWVGDQEFPFTVTFNREYLPLDKYIQVLDSVDVLALNSIRPAGMGNFWIAILFGKTVLLNRDNLAGRMMKELGLTFYYIDEWCKDVRFPSPGEINRNKEICLEYYTEKRMSDAYIELFN